MKLATTHSLFHFSGDEMRALGIAGIFLFGSQAQGVARESSDYDFGIVFSDPSFVSDRKKRTIVYDALYDIIAPQINKPVTIDIVFTHEADLQFRAHIVRDGVLLYNGDSTAVGNFIEKTMEEHADFAPHRFVFHQAMLERMRKS